MASTRQRPFAYTARTADRHMLYQMAVQAPEYDARFYSRYFERYTGKPLRRFREDFCGTAVLSCAFVRLHRDNHALGIDRHGPTLAWGRKRNVATMLDADMQRRLTLKQADVRAVQRPRAQMLVAVNFSWMIFKQRQELLGYLRNCHRSLEPGGLLVLDSWGGPDVQVQMTDRRKKPGFTYLWEQRSFEPITHDIECRIHFEFKDGTRLRDAFTYHWRLWTLPELRELFAEAGFHDIHVLWEGTDRATRGGNGVFRRVTRGDDSTAWIAYVIGQKR